MRSAVLCVSLVLGSYPAAANAQSASTVIERYISAIGGKKAIEQIVSTDVSREHAEIALENGRYLLRDRASTYGTYVNGEQVTERALQHGDRIRLGRTDAVELVFMTEGTKSDDAKDEARPASADERERGGTP